MTCKHCTATITGVLESLDAPVAEIDLVTKRVVAGFGRSRHGNALSTPSGTLATQSSLR
jgi:copper chaperone CopZ